MKVISITDQQIIFDDGTTISYHHDQDCCETVYADFESLKTTSFVSESFKNIEIKGVDDSGITINGYFCPCYDQQNGFYSSNLEIVVTSPLGVETSFDISSYTKYVDG